MGRPLGGWGSKSRRRRKEGRRRRGRRGRRECREGGIEEGGVGGGCREGGVLRECRECRRCRSEKESSRKCGGGAEASLAQSRPKRKLGSASTPPRSEYIKLTPPRTIPSPRRTDPPPSQSPAMSRTLFRSLEPLLSSARVQFRPSASGPLRALQRRRYARSPADDPNFTSVLDRPSPLVRSGQKGHGPGILVLGLLLSPLPPPPLPSPSPSSPSSSSFPSLFLLPHTHTPTTNTPLPPQPRSQSPPSSSAPGSCAASAGKPT